MQRHSPPEPPAPRPPRRRPGRLRRWLVRPAAWVLAATAVLLYAASLAVDSEPLRGLARARIEGALGTYLERPVHIRAINLNILPPEVVAAGIEIAGRAPGDPPVLAADRARVVADLTAWRSRVLTLRRIEVDRPRLTLELAADGSTNLPRLGGRRRGDRPRRLEVRLGALVLRGGEVRLDERRFPLALEARGLRGFAEAVGREVQGWLSAREVAAILPGAQAWPSALEARLRIARGTLELQRGRLAGADLAADFGGRLTWGEAAGGQPARRLDLEARLAGNGAVLDRLGYLHGEVAGPFRFTGRLGWRPGDWGFAGALTSPGLLLAGRQVKGLEGTVSGDRTGVRLDLARAAYGGGALGGRVRVDLQPPQRPVTVELTLDGADLESLAADQGIPLFGLQGRVDGEAAYRFPGRDPLAGAGGGTLRIAGAPAGPLPGFVGEVGLQVAGGALTVTAGRLATPRQLADFTGRVDLSTGAGDLSFTVETQDVAELMPLLPLDPAAPPPLWLPFAGRGWLRAEVALGPAGTAGRVSLDLTDVAASGLAADRVRGSFGVREAGIEGLALDLARPGAALAVAGSVPLAVGARGAPVPFRLTLDAAGWALADARPWLPFDVPASGPASGSVTLGGSLEALEGRVEAIVAPVEIAGLSLPQGRIEVGFDPARALVELALAGEAGSVSLTGSVPIAGGGLDLDIASTRLDVARPPFRDLAAGGLAGNLEVVGQIEGTLKRPQIVLQLEARDLTLAERPLGEAGRASLLAFWDGDQVAVDGSVLGLASFAGRGRLDERGLALPLAVSGEDLHSLARAFVAGPLPEFGGRFAGTLRLADDFATDEPALVALELPDVEIRYGAHRLVPIEPVALALGPEGLALHSVYLADEGRGSEVFVSGKVGMSAEVPLDLRLQGTLEADWLRPWLPGVEVAGAFDWIATVRGTAGRPAINGQGELRGGRAIVDELPQALEGIAATVLAYPEQLVLDHAEARFGAGTLRAGGTVALFGSTAAPFSYRLQLSASRLALRYPEGWLLEGGAELQAQSTPDGRRVRGAVRLDRALYYQEVKLGLTQLLAGFFRRAPLVVESTDALLAGTQLDLVVTGPGALRVRNNLADLTGDIDLSVRGSLASPVLFGRVELSPGGTLVYADNEYRLERGVLNFANPYRVEPVIDLLASARIDQYDLSLQLTGTLDRLEPRFTSEPALSDLEVLALMTTGQAAEPAVLGGPASAEGAELPGAESFLAGQAASLLAERVNTLFRLDRFRIDPLTGPSGEASAARVTVGKRFSRDLFATYSYDPSQTAAQVLEVEWRVSPGFTLVLTQNGDGTYAADGRWERRY